MTRLAITWILGCRVMDKWDEGCFLMKSGARGSRSSVVLM